MDAKDLRVGFLAGGGRMGALMRSYDWSRTPLGDPAEWPESLKAAIATCLNSRFPMVVWWGPQLLMLYNDAWQPILGHTKHPSGLGRPGQESWPETWPVVGVQFADALKGTASWSEDLLLASDRNGYLEESYFTYSHSPLMDGTGKVVGVLSVVSETTARVLNERRLKTLSKLSAVAADAPLRLTEIDKLYQELLDSLCAENPDAPFAFQYHLDTPHSARLSAVAGLDASPLPLTVDSTDDDKWGIAQALRTQSGLTIGRPVSQQLPGGPWPEPVTQLDVIPILPAGHREQPCGILVVGINARLRLNPKYRRFLQLVAAQFGHAVSAFQYVRREQQALEDARSAARMRDEFLAMVSHELRSPLNAIVGWTHLLKGIGSRPDLIEKGVEVIERNALLQAKVVTDLLDVSRALSGNLQFDMQDFDITSAIRSAVESVAPAATAKGIAIHTNFDPAPQFVHGDPARTGQILWNLFSNALKFTPRGGQIDVSTEAGDQHVSIRIRDNGDGIDPAFLPHLFERFRQADSSASRRHGGLGLGLAIAKQFAELQGGRISASSDGLGCGSSFCLEVAKPRPQPMLLGDRRHAVATPVPGRRELMGASILIIDDHLDSRLVLQQVLEAAAAEVEAASCAEDALKIIEGRQFDVIVTDIAMPRIDGYEFMKELKRRGIEAPVIALTAHALLSDVNRAIQAGFSAHIAKPIDTAALLAAVSRAVRPDDMSMAGAS